MKICKFKFLAVAMSCMVIAFCTGTQSIDTKFAEVETAKSFTAHTVQQNEQESSIQDALVSKVNTKPVVNSTYWENISTAGGAVANSLYQMIDFSVRNPGKAFTLALAASLPVTAAITVAHKEKYNSLVMEYNCDKCACICSTYELVEGMGANGVPYDASPQMGNTYNWFKTVNIGNFSDQNSCGTACTTQGNHLKGCFTFKSCTQLTKSEEFKKLLAEMSDGDKKPVNSNLRPCLLSIDK